MTLDPPVASVWHNSGSLDDAIAAFLLAGELANHTPATQRTYAYVLERFTSFCLAHGTQTVAVFTEDVIQQHLADLRTRMKPISLHQAFRVLRTFSRWCVRTGRLTADPMAGMTMRVPKTLPRVPDDEDVHRLLAVCPNTLEGRRNRVLIGLAADSGLRKEELRRLRIGDLDFTTRMVHVYAGKGQKDGTTFFGDATASLLRAWLAVHPAPHPAALVFCTRGGTILGPYTIRQILHRLSVRAGLSRKIGPHSLRHYAATSILRQSGNLELVRQVLRHTTLTMALRYATLTQTEIAARFQRVAPLDRLWAMRAPDAPGTRRLPRGGSATSLWHSRNEKT